VPNAPAQVFLTATGRLLVANQGTKHQPGTTLSVLDAATLNDVGRVDVGSGPHGVVAEPAGRFAWVTNQFDGTLSTVDLVGLSQVAVTTVGANPNGVSFSTTTVRGSSPRQVSVSVPPREDRGEHSHSSGH
jgi:YVTN family beta-propeller protein